MRVLALIVALAGIAAAEPRRTNEAVALRKKPGEKEEVVGKVPANTVVTVLEETGRWVKVRAPNGAIGYVTRTTLNDPDAHAMAPSGEWSAAFMRGGGALPSAMTAGELKGNAPARDDFTRPAPSGLVLRAELGLGYRSLGMDLTSNADGGLTNYLVDADAVATTLDVDAVRRLTGRWFVAGDARVAASTSSPGIEYPGPTATPGKIPFQTFAGDLGVRGGLRARDVFDLSLRLGAHYDAFLPENVNNAGMLPRERLLGATLGARVEIAPPASRFSIALRCDVLALGSRAQTAGLEDGKDSTAHAVWGGATVRYFTSRHISPFAAYDFGRATTSWTGMSSREPAVTSAHRVDTTQLLAIGISAEL